MSDDRLGVAADNVAFESAGVLFGVDHPPALANTNPPLRLVRVRVVDHQVEPREGELFREIARDRRRGLGALLERKLHRRHIPLARAIEIDAQRLGVVGRQVQLHLAARARRQ